MHTCIYFCVFPYPVFVVEFARDEFPALVAEFVLDPMSKKTKKKIGNSFAMST